MITAHTPAFWRATLALALGSFMIFCNLYTTQPLLPLLRAAFGVSELVAGLTVSLATLTLGVSLLVFGPLSDALGRTRIMLLTMALATACTIGLALLEGFWALLALRALQGFWLGGLPAIAVAYLGDEFERRAMLLAVGLYIAGNSLGGITGRLVSGVVAEQWGWQAAFVAMSGLSLVCLLAFYWLLPASREFRPQPLGPRRVLRDLGGHLRDPRLLPAYLVGGLNFFIFVNQYSYVTYRLSAPPYGLSAQWLGMLFLTYLAGTLASALSGRVLARFTAPQTMAVGIALFGAGSLLTLAAPLALILGGLTLGAFGFFLTHAVASGWVGREARRARASASSLYLLFYYLGASLGGFYLDPFWRLAAWPGVIAASLAVLALTATLSLRLQRRVTAA